MAELGDKVKDRISGLEGVVTGRIDYLYGCRQVLVNPQEVKDGKPIESSWLDEDRVEVVQAGCIPRPATAAAAAGGPMLDTPPMTGCR